MKTQLFICICLLFLVSCSADPDDCQLPDWVGEWSRVDGGGCDDWETRTNQTITIAQSMFDEGSVRIFSLPEMMVNGCELEHEFAGTTSTWEIKRNGQLRYESDSRGCWAEYEKD